MAFSSPLGLGAQLIGGRRRRRPHSKKKVVKGNNLSSNISRFQTHGHSQKKKNESEVDIKTATSRFQLKPHGHSQKQKNELEVDIKTATSRFQLKPHGHSQKKKNELEVDIKTASSSFQLKPHGQKRKQQFQAEIKEKKGRGNGCVNFSSTSIFNFNDNQEDVIAREILSWLPVKCLIRFKSVCKYWFSVIEEDVGFISLHLERSRARPCLLVANSIDNRSKYEFMTASLVFGDKGAISAAKFHTIREIEFGGPDLMLKPVFGLIGFFGERRDDPGVCIFNLSTRKMTPWIVSNLLRDVRRQDLEASNKIAMATCTLGYDPISKEHKVVGIWRSSQPSYVVCEVLTVGDNEWRRIDEVPPHDIELHGSSVYINGSIYYTTKFLGMFEAGEKEKKFIVGFDVGSEKFRAIRVPSYIFEQPENYNFRFYHIMLLELNGRLGLFSILEKSGYTPKLWVLNEDRNRKNSRNSWTEVSIQLPYTLGGGRCDFACDPVPGTDQLILTSYLKTSGGKISESTCHSYNWKKKTFNAIDFSGISSAPCFSSASTVGSFFESLFPIQKR
ncbi:hypothetical protein C5167_024309, partial [Papaver somniferum]